jgi:hypothetical protein
VGGIAVKKQLISGHFSSIPLATLIASTMDIDEEDVISNDEASEEKQPGEQEPSGRQ